MYWIQTYLKVGVNWTKPKSAKSFDSSTLPRNDIIEIE